MENGNYPNVSVFEMFDKQGVENCKIVLLELVNCESKDELLAREAFYIKSLVCVNKFIPLRTRKEYLVDNKEKILEEQKEYYNDNKEKYTCACGKMTCIYHKSRHEKSNKHLTYLEKIK